MSGSQKTQEKKANTKNGILRLIFVVIAILLEIGLMVLIYMTGLSRHPQIYAAVSRIAATLLVLGIYSQNKTPSMKMPWIILFLVFPAVGISLYLMIGLSGSTARARKRFALADARLMPYLVQDAAAEDALKAADPSCSAVSRYILRESQYPLCANTHVVYYPDAALALEAQKEALRSAKSFIFMEYFTIENARAWQEIEEILAEKAAEGVEVRVFYDDFGSIAVINHDFADRLEKRGIRCRVFNPMIPLLNMFLNNRDHRKITIVDGRIGFTGGYNMADEYFNITSPYGHWKDTGIRLEGEAVRSMTVAFLEMWNAVRADDEDDVVFEKYLGEACPVKDAQGFVQFYADTPMDKKPVGEDVYMGMVSRAQNYIYFMTPYLIITDEMSRQLRLAAKSGVDVRIITPGIPDKKIIYQVTRSYYSALASNGVRIYEYTPGFCHAKMCVSDDIIATCGTINMDYRSLYHHFEDGCLLAGSQAVADMRADFEETFKVCTEVTEKYRSGRFAALRFGQLVLRLFASLM